MRDADVAQSASHKYAGAQVASASAGRDLKIETHYHLERVAFLQAPECDLPVEDRIAEDERKRSSLTVAVAGRAYGTSENFVLDPTPETLPLPLRRRRPVIHRETVVDNLKRLFTRRHQDGSLIVLAGPPRSGKSAILQEFATALSNLGPDDPPVALLYANLSDAPRPLRSLYLALRGTSLLPSSALGSTGLAEEDETEASLSAEADFVRGYLLTRLGGRSLVTMLEGFAEQSGDEAYVREMRSMLESRPFCRAFNLLETQGESLLTPALLHTSILLEPFSAPQATDFLVKEGQPDDRAKDAVDLLINDRGLFYPGILLQGAFRYDPQLVAIKRESPTAEDLALAIMEQASNVAQSVVEAVCSLEDCDPQAAMTSLMAMSVFHKIPISAKQLSAAQLAPIPTQGLLRLGWLERAHGLTLQGFCHYATRAAAAMVLSGREVTGQSPASLRMAIQRLSSILFSDCNADAFNALDESVAWLRRCVPQETILMGFLQALLMQTSAADPVSPLSLEEESKVAPEFLRRGAESSDLDAALAALVLYAREPFDDKAASRSLLGAKFLESLDNVSALLRSGRMLNSRQLLALDSAIYAGSRRFHLFHQTLTARKAVSDELRAQERIACDKQDGLWLSAWLSFLLNLADLSLSVGNRLEAFGFTKHAREIAEEANWLREDSWKYWRLARLVLLESRLAGNASEERVAVAKATEHAALCLKLAPGQPRCVRFYLRTVRRLVEAEGDEHARQQHVEFAKANLEGIYGPCERWDLSIRAQFAALMREEARRAWSIPYQRIRAREALEVLGTQRPNSRREIDHDPQACLVQARLQAFLGEDEAALVSCDKAIDQIPTPAAWHLKLRLLDESGSGQHDWTANPELAPSNFVPMPSKLREAIRAFRTWTRLHSLTGHSYGEVLLWITEREWRAAGSLERHVTRDLSRHQIDYNSLPKEEKLKRLSGAFQTRRQQLIDIGKRFGTSIALTLAEFRVVSQYIRSKSVLTGDATDPTPALAIIDAGLERWPGSHILLFWRAEYLRYIWDVDAAIERFRTLRAIATSGDLRRRAALSLVRTLHTAIVHREDGESPQRVEWLGEARHVLDELSGSFDDADEVAILRDYIALESGDEVDWTALEGVYERIVGQIHGFPTTLIANYDRMPLDSTGSPINLAQVLQSNFANPDTLGYAGTLYLVRAEKQLGDQPQEDFRCAVAFLYAQAILERSWTGSEYPATSFRIGRAIVSAARAFRSLNPIKGLDPDGRPDQLALAEAKFNSARSRSAGSFRETARIRQAHATRLRAQLKEERSLGA